jgi:hypothetical protein
VAQREVSALLFLSFANENSALQTYSTTQRPSLPPSAHPMPSLMMPILRIWCRRQTGDANLLKRYKNAARDGGGGGGGRWGENEATLELGALGVVHNAADVGAGVAAVERVSGGAEVRWGGGGGGKRIGLSAGWGLCLNAHSALARHIARSEAEAAHDHGGALQHTVKKRRGKQRLRNTFKKKLKSCSDARFCTSRRRQQHL